MEQNSRTSIVTELKRLITKSHAHVSLEEALADLPPKARTEIPGGLPYSIWQLVDHMRFTQKDIVEFSLSADYKAKSWPDDYWTSNKEEVTDEEWEASLKELNTDRAAFLSF